MSRRTRYRRGSAAALVILIVLVIGLGAFSAYQYFQTDSLSKDMEQAQAENSQLSSQIQTLQEQNQSLQEQNDALQNDFQSMQEQYNELQNKTTANQTSVNEQDPDEKVAYLTFDDGPSKVTSHLLNVLDDLDVKATFFVSFAGSDTKEKRDLLKEESSRGHAVGVHTWTHDYYTIYANKQNFLDDFNKMKEVITQCTGKTPNVSRFPGGASNTVSITASDGQVIMPTLAKAVQEMGFQFFDWNAGGYDAEKPYPTSGELAAKVLNDADGQNAVVILLHDTHDFTVEAIPEIVNGLRSRGYTFKILTPESPAIQQAFAKSKNS